jgi:peptidoglycan/LPS O-acetylase OafA/YrhL
MTSGTANTLKRVHRTDIQALRALAVLSVVIFHLWPNRLPGGFVGVDVFFVISGFLITQHLLRDVAKGTFSVITFWARRIRRLLPASLTVLVFTAAAIFLVAPKDLWPTWISEVGASAAYFENWTLANNAVDYLAADNAASPTQHFWSLSVEEQFYFSLPILIWLLVVTVRKKSMVVVSRAVVWLLAAIVLSSLVAAIYLTYAEPVSSYFFTQVRAWQFGAGALLASVWASVPTSKNFKLTSFLLGISLIVLPSVFLNGAMAYPGFWALIPTIGAVLALASDLEDGPLAELMSWKPIQFIGDVSYSIYLWHWPLIILLPYVLGELTTFSKLAIIGLSFGLAALSQKFIEQPFINFGRREGARNHRAITGMAIACGALLASSMAVAAHADESIRVELTQQQQVVNSGLDCLGAASNAPDGKVCVNPDLEKTLMPSVDLASHDSPSLLLPASCQGTKASDSIPKPCNLTGKQSSTKIALIGDSHSAQFMAPMLALALKNDWQVVSFSKGGCPLSYAERTHDPILKSACKKWVKAAVAQLKNQNFDLVVTSQVSGTEWASGTQKQSTYSQLGLVRVWRELNSAGVPVIVLKDNPRPIKSVLICIKKNKFDNLDKCQNSKTKAMLFDPQPGAALSLNSPKTKLVDFTDVYCDSKMCDAVIGGVIVNRDENHLTNTFSRTLAPYLEQEILSLLKN